MTAIQDCIHAADCVEDLCGRGPNPRCPDYRAKTKEEGMKEPWLYGVKVRKIGNQHHLRTPHGAKATGMTREEAMVNYVNRSEAGRKRDAEDQQ